MPADRRSDRTWTKNREFDWSRQVNTDDSQTEEYVPASVEDCTSFILSLCLPEIDVYDDETGVRTELATEMARHVYIPGEPVMPRIDTFRQSSFSPEAAQDLEHERFVALTKAERQIAIKNDPDSAANRHLVTISVLSEKEELSTMQRPAEMVRSFG